MSSASWTMFDAPFGANVVRWHAVAVDRAHDRVRLAPHLDPAALGGRLDAALGRDGWSVRLRPLGDDALTAELAVQGAVRCVVVAPARSPGLGPDDTTIEAGDAVTGAAWTAVCVAFGATVPVAVQDDGWVEADPVTLEPLRRPEFVVNEVVNEAAPAGGRLEPSEQAHDAADAGPLTAAGDTGSEASEPSEGKPEAHVVIDRLIERLRAEGLGADAARLVAKHGGYGADANASRALYAELRSLLLERGAPT